MENKIIEQQIQWAKAQNIAFTYADKKQEKPYTTNLADNLFLKKLDPDTTYKEFKNADGNELKSKSPKMSALHSSSALVVNVFDYWRDKLPLLAKALGIGGIEKFNFEFKSPTGAGGNDANIDVVLETATEIIGIESKFTEWFTRRENKLKEAYFPKQKKSLWDEKEGYSELHKLAIEMIPQTSFLHLDAAQLMKHILGLTNYRDEKAQGKTLKLIYLYYDCTEDKKVCETHKKEIATFTEKFKAEGITFEVMAYQELFGKLQKIVDSGHTDYLQYLEERYFGWEK